MSNTGTSESAQQVNTPPRRIPGFPAGGVALPGIAPMRRPPSPEPEEAAPDVADRDEATGAGEESQDETSTPRPPLPAGRPPQRSIPEPASEADERADEEEEAVAPPPLPSGRPPVPPPVAEPESYEAGDVDDEGDMPAPPPPQPQGGLPPPPLSVPPPVPASASPPTSPSSRGGLFKPKSRQGSMQSVEPVQSRSSLDAPRSSMDGGGSAYEELQRSGSVQSGSSPLPSLPEAGGVSAGQIAGGGGGGGGGSSTMDSGDLVSLSNTLGAQVFAAAHTKLSNKGAREQSGETLVEFCLTRATNARAPVAAYEYGAVVLHVEGNSKSKGVAVVQEVDEPRAGDGENREKVFLVRSAARVDVG